MAYLVAMFTRLGGTLIQKEVTDVHETFTEFDVVTNCTGLGSRALFHDEKLFPVRGQMIKIKANGFDQVVVDDAGPNVLSLVVPRVHDIMLGGTIQENDWNTQVDPKDTQDILRKVALIAPGLKNIEVISEQVGLRPVRDAVRLEKENFDGGKTVIHNYGHGGAGLTLSWGCAKDVVAIVQSL
jgi:D-amino-acid oxidase